MSTIPDPDARRLGTMDIFLFPTSPPFHGHVAADQIAGVCTAALLVDGDPKTADVADVAITGFVFSFFLCLQGFAFRGTPFSCCHVILLCLKSASI
jgi:hypothetical protein